MSSQRRKFEEYFEKHRLPDGSKVSIVDWSWRGLVAGFIAAIISAIVTKDVLNIIAWFLSLALIVSWGGPYLEYAIAWQRKKTKE